MSRFTKVCYNCGYMDFKNGPDYCKFCQTKYSPIKFFDGVKLNKGNRDDWVVKQLGHPIPKDIHEARLKWQAERYKKVLEDIERSKTQRISEYYAAKAKQQEGTAHGMVKCPTCGCNNVDKIGTLDRAVSVSMFGLASNKIGKSFKCKKCGYTW